MIYKKALYLYEIFNDAGDLLLYNVRNSKALKVSKDNIQCYRSITEKLAFELEETDKSALLDKLIADQFIVPETFDEIKWCKFKKNEVIYGSKELDVVLIPTNMCNFKCTYCFQSHIENYMSEEAERRVVKFLEKKIPQCKMFRVGLFGGEPLLCADQLIRILTVANEICKKNGVPMVGEISTNGYLLTPEVFSSLLKLRVFDFQVCLDGPKEMHNKTRPHIRNEDSYSVIMQNIKSIKKNIKSKNYRFTIRINVTPQVEPFLDDFLKELSFDFKDDPCFQIAIQCVRDWGGENITCDQIVDEEPSRYKRWYGRIRELNMLGASKLHFNPFTYCTAYRKNGYTIDYDGSILKCTHSVEDDNKVGFIDEYGNDIIDEWKTAKWFETSNDAEKMNVCSKCILYPFCMEGYCPYAKNILNKNACNFEITISMIKQKLLELDKLGNLPII